MLWTPGTSELPLAPSHASVPVFPLQLSAESRKPGYRQAPSGDLAALTMEPETLAAQRTSEAQQGGTRAGQARIQEE